VLGVFNAQWLGTILIYVAAVLTVISMVHYLRRALPHARG
jgi:phosphatidylglycerophosphate synthase